MTPTPRRSEKHSPIPELRIEVTAQKGQSLLQWGRTKWNGPEFSIQMPTEVAEYLLKAVNLHDKLVSDNERLRTQVSKLVSALEKIAKRHCYCGADEQGYRYCNKQEIAQEVLRSCREEQLPSDTK